VLTGRTIGPTGTLWEKHSKLREGEAGSIHSYKILMYSRRRGKEPASKKDWNGGANTK